jgi:hypothetical protein
VHAWGFVLFRAVAFKYQRFIDTDDNTKRLIRCDVARIKIVSSEKKVIDSVMAVTIRGRRFDIRVIEEVRGSTGEKWCDVNNTRGREDDAFSKASSGGGVSAVGVVEGFSESGSDADVSDSGQALLEVEKRGIVSLQIDNVLVRETPGGKNVTEDIPHILGKSAVLVEDRVNLDVDNRQQIRLIKSAGGDKFLEIGQAGSPLVHHTNSDTSVTRQLVYEEEKSGSIGPAHANGSPVTFRNGEDAEERECEGNETDVNGPLVLRTRLGDLWVGGSNKKCADVGGVDSTNVASDSIDSVGDKQDRYHSENRSRTKEVTKKKLPVYNNTNLPLNMLRKLPGPIHSKKKSVHKKRGGKEGEGIGGDEHQLGSDPIQNPDEIGSTEDDDEVVSGQEEDTELIPNTPPSNIYVEGGGFGSEQGFMREGVQDSREVCEAKKLIAIGGELGIKFRGGEGEDVARMMARDCSEKEDWETRGFQ